MTIDAPNALRIGVALFVGGVIGVAYVAAQEAARRKHAMLRPKSSSSDDNFSVPGSGRRAIVLGMALVAVQWICPLLFVAGTQWWVTGGVLLGAGWQRLRNLRDRSGPTRR
jgi:hypothetical protein